MSNDTEPKKRGHSCCPTDAAIYRAVNDDPRVQPFTGTAREIADRLGHGDNYIRHIARTGVTTKKGWRIELETPGPYTGINNAIPRDYIAERPDDDPIIGPVEEIADAGNPHKIFSDRYPGYWLAEFPDIRQNPVTHGWEMSFVLYKPDSPDLESYARRERRRL